MHNFDALMQSLGRFTQNTKDAVGDISNGTVVDLDALVVDMTNTFDAELVEMGAPNGGSFNSALAEKHKDIVGVDIDVSVANHFSKTITGATAFRPVNVAEAGFVNVFMLSLTNPGTNVTWWSGIRWNGGVKPTPTVTGRDVYSFSTKDGGVTWDGYIVGQNLKAAA